MTFHQYSKEIVTEYLGNISYVDDLIFTERNVKKPFAKTDIISATRESAAEESIKKGETGIKKQKQQLIPNIDPKVFTNAFLKKGIQCSLFEITNDDDPLEDIAKILCKSDVVILDWQMHQDNGKKATELLKSVLNKSKKPELRLFVVYTDASNYTRLLEESIIPELKKINIDGNIDDSGCIYKFGHSKIIVLEKVNGNQSEDSITDEDLPEKIIEEFADITSGIISNALLKSISLIRNHSHNLLGIFNKDIDPGLLAHKSLLSNPSDFPNYIQELIKNEIGCLIESEGVRGILADEILDIWIDKHFKEKVPTISIYDINYSLQSDIAKSILKKGIEDDDVLKAILETQKKNKSIPKKERKKIGKEIKSIIHNQMTSVFNPSEHLSEKIDLSISCLNSFKNNIALDLKPKLGFGSIILDDKGNYWLCMQPKCDSVRIAKPTNFFFLQLRTANQKEKFDLVLKNNEEFLKLIINQKISKATQIEFKNSPNSDTVFAVKNEDSEFILEDTSQNKYTWCGELKTEYAQRVSNNFAANLSRVGMDEYEWLRRS